MSIFEDYGNALASKLSPTTPSEPQIIVEPAGVPKEIVVQPLSPKSTYIHGQGSESNKELFEKLGKLATAGMAGITKARELFENIKAKREHKDLDKLEKEIASLEEAKKEALKQVGLEEQKTKLEAELNALKKPKLQEVAI